MATINLKYKQRYTSKKYGYRFHHLGVQIARKYLKSLNGENITKTYNNGILTITA